MADDPNSKLGSLQYRPRDPVPAPARSVIHQLIQAWGLAEPAMDRIVEQTDWVPWLQRLFLVLDDSPDDVDAHNQLIQELIDGVEGVLFYHQPHHDEGWQRPEQWPSYCLPALINVLRLLTIVTKATPAMRRVEKSAGARKKPRCLVPPLVGKARPAYASRGGTYYHTDETLKRVLECIDSKKMSNAEIARRFGMSPSYVSNLAHGKSHRIMRLRGNAEPSPVVDDESDEPEGPLEKPLVQYTEEELAELERMEREDQERQKAAQ